MSDNPNAFEDYEPIGEDNPFWDLEGWDKSSDQEDPFELVERQVLDTLGISSFDDILITDKERVIDNARGNRFESIKEAIFYLFDSGILQFSGVVIDSEDYEVEVDADTGRGTGQSS